jgi:hypothetical protein
MTWVTVNSWQWYAARRDVERMAYLPATGDHEATRHNYRCKQFFASLRSSHLGHLELIGFLVTIPRGCCGSLQYPCHAPRLYERPIATHQPPVGEAHRRGPPEKVADGPSIYACY